MVNMEEFAAATAVSIYYSIERGGVVVEMKHPQLKFLSVLPDCHVHFDVESMTVEDVLDTCPDMFYDELAFIDEALVDDCEDGYDFAWDLMPLINTGDIVVQNQGNQNQGTENLQK